jgi:hypothetical protein
MWLFPLILAIWPRRGTHRKHSFRQLLYYFVFIRCCGNSFYCAVAQQWPPLVPLFRLSAVMSQYIYIYIYIYIYVCVCVCVCVCVQLRQLFLHYSFLPARLSHCCSQNVKPVLWTVGTATCKIRSRDSSVSRAARSQVGQPSDKVSISGWSRYNSLLPIDQIGLKTTTFPVRWVPGSFSLGKSDKSNKLITHLNLVPKLQTHGALSPLFHTSSWLHA